MKGHTKPASPGANAHAAYDVERIRGDFPILHQSIHGNPLVYLDNAATAQKPTAVIDAITHYYSHDNSNVHRGVHTLSVRATEVYESARERTRQFLGAADVAEIIFVRGTTEAVNLVAEAWGRANVTSGDNVIISEMEHHSNIVPWQMLCNATGATLRVIPMNDRGELIMEDYEKLLTAKTKIVSVAHTSNSLGTVNPLREIIGMAHGVGALVFIDGAQATPHGRVDVRALDCDFFAFSGHKTYGPTGIGVLYGKQETLEKMNPYQGGGDMIASVTFDKTTYNRLPHRYEAGTPNVAGAAGLGAVMDYLTDIGYDAIATHENDLVTYATGRLESIPGVSLIGTAQHKVAVVSFVLDGIHPHDAGTILDREGIAVRAGHHCTQPVMDHFGVPATLRASFGVYNTRGEIDALVAGIDKVKELFA